MHNATKLRQELDDLRVQLTITAADNEQLRANNHYAELVIKHNVSVIQRMYPAMSEQTARNVLERKIRCYGGLTMYEGIRRAVDDLGWHKTRMQIGLT